MLLAGQKNRFIVAKLTLLAILAGAVAGITILLMTIDGAIGLRPEIRRRLGW